METNVDVKIGSKATAKRLETVLPNIIHYNQCAYVKGRTICDAIRTVEDIMEFTERYCINGKMICIDFKKTYIENFEIKNSVKIWGVHFMYDSRAKRKLNFDEIVTSMQKLHFWRWRDLTIFGRIQIVKTFIIPIFLYRASMVCCDQEFVKEVNKIIFDFIWKGKNKVKRSVLVGDIEDGGLKDPHLYSMIETENYVL